VKCTAAIGSRPIVVEVKMPWPEKGNFLFIEVADRSLEKKTAVRFPMRDSVPVR